jgi:hypothetical protein
MAAHSRQFALAASINGSGRAGNTHECHIEFQFKKMG